MDASNNSTSVFSLKFDENNDEIEIIQESGVESNCTGFQNEFYNCIANSFTKEEQVSPDVNKADLSCKKCGKKYKYLALLNTHYMSCNGKRDILQVCPTCKKTYKSTMAYKKHLIVCLQSTSTPCLVDRTLCFCCEEPTKFAHAGSVPCPKCPRAFRSQKGLNRHLMLLHAPSVKFKCELCNVQCSNNYILKLHRQSHTDDIDRIERGSLEYKCNLCDKSYLEKTAFDIHVSNHKREDASPSISYKCKTCQVELPSLEAHSSHVCKSVGYKCNLCGKMLSSRGFYQRHINTHKKYNELAGSSDVNANTDSADNMNQAKSIMLTDETAPTIKEESDDLSAEDEEKPQFDRKHASNMTNIRILNGMNIYKRNENQEAMVEESAKRGTNLESILKNIGHQEETFVVTFLMDDETLRKSVASFLEILLDAEILQGFGWPEAPVEKVVIDILQHLDCKISSIRDNEGIRLRENVRSLIETVVDDAEAIKIKDNIFFIDTLLRDIIKYSS